tara:strand:+ start:744 stop:893 length:150 start_codon:yes stop_codon:yes gene_type:complete
MERAKVFLGGSSFLNIERLKATIPQILIMNNRPKNLIHYLTIISNFVGL